MNREFLNFPRIRNRFKGGYDLFAVRYQGVVGGFPRSARNREFCRPEQGIGPSVAMAMLPTVTTSSGRAQSHREPAAQRLAVQNWNRRGAGILALRML